MTEGPRSHVILFACIENAGRSQIAKALFNMLVNPSSATAISAGTRPAEHIHPEVMQVLREIGVDLSCSKPQKLTAELAATADLLVTMGCGEECPYVPGLRVVSWQIPNPHGQNLDEVRKLRDLLQTKVLELAQQEGYQCKSTPSSAV